MLIASRLAVVKDYKSAIGPISFDAKGQSVMTVDNIMFIQTGKNGEIRLLDTVPDFNKKMILGF